MPKSPQDHPKPFRSRKRLTSSSSAQTSLEIKDPRSKDQRETPSAKPTGKDFPPSLATRFSQTPLGGQRLLQLEKMQAVRPGARGPGRESPDSDACPRCIWYATAGVPGSSSGCGKGAEGERETRAQIPRALPASGDRGPLSQGPLLACVQLSRPRKAA